MFIKNKNFLYLGIIIFWIIIWILFYYKNFFYIKNPNIICECSNHNSKYWPKWEKCFEQMEQNIWSRWYYWELKYEKKTYYYLLKCK